MIPVGVLGAATPRASGGGGGAGDDFSSDTLANYTEFANAAASWSISGGFLNGSGGNQAILSPNGVSFANGTITGVFTAGADAGLVLRLADNNNYYLLVLMDSLSGDPGWHRLYKRVGGSFTQIGLGYMAFTRGTPFTASFSAVGTALKVIAEGEEIISVTDSSHSSGRCGIRVSGGGAGIVTCDSLAWPA